MDERERVEKILEGDGDDWPPVAERIRATRETLGLSEAAVASRLGLSGTEYRDVEMHDDEIFMVLSVKEVAQLARILDIPVTELLFGPSATRPAAPATFPQVLRGLEALAVKEGVAVAGLSDRIGWELDPLMRDPEALGELNLDGLRDVCAAAGVDWVGVLEWARGRADDDRGK